MPRYTGVNHLALVTGDMDATIRFWRDLLGLKIIAAMGRPGFRQYFFALSDTDMIGFFEWDDVEPIDEKDHGAPVKGKFAFDHVSLGVESEEDLWELRDTLDAAGFWVSEPVDHGFIHSIYSFDPNGIPIEFSRCIAGVDLHSTPRLADHYPSDITMEGPEPQQGKWPAVEAPTPKDERMVFPGEGHDLIHSAQNKWNNNT